MSNASAPATSTPTSDPDNAGIIVREEQAAVEAIRSALQAAGIDPGHKPIDLRALPFEGTWGSASTICRLLAGELVNQDLAATGALDGLSKKESKQRVNELVGPKAQELAEQVAATMAASGPIRERRGSQRLHQFHLQREQGGRAAAGRSASARATGTDRRSLVPRPSG